MWLHVCALHFPRAVLEVRCYYRSCWAPTPPREGQGADRATLALLSPPLRWEDETGWPCHCRRRAPRAPYEAAGGEVPCLLPPHPSTVCQAGRGKTGELRTLGSH